MQLKIRAVNFHLLVQLPLGVLKQILLEYLRYESERDAQTSATDSEEEGSCSTGQEQTPPVVLTIGAPRAFNSFSINVSVCDQDGEDESAMEQKVLVKFKSDMRFSVVKVKQKDANTESYCVLQLQLCARCGSGNGCSCGWRSVHSVLKNEEELSLLEAIETKLVRRLNMLPCLVVNHQSTHKLGMLRTAEGCCRHLNSNGQMLPHALD